MKKSLYMFLFVFVTVIAASSCREKTTGEKIEDSVEEVGDEIEDATDDN